MFPMGRRFLYDVKFEQFDVPEWSGQFTQINEGAGLMMISPSDQRTHPFPDGWVATHIAPMDEFELYILEAN